MNSAAIKTSVSSSLIHFANDIKIAHSIFALPFAATAILLSSSGIPNVSTSLLLLVCMVLARSFAMGMNRYLDRDIDLENPRTKSRKIPNGDLSPASGLSWSLLSGALFILAAFQLNQLSGYLSAPLLLILAGYSLMKKISWFTHWYLGMCLGFAPIAISIALIGRVEIPVLLIGIGVSFWTAGFDVLYSLQDKDFDRSRNLHSFPAKFGSWNSVLVSRFSFFVMVACLVLAGVFSSVGVLYYVATTAVAAILVYEHWLVRDVKELGYSKNIDAAFFNVNAWVSVCFYLLVQIDYLI